MATAVIEALNIDRIKNVILEEQPQLKDDEDTTLFLSEEIFRDKSRSLQSPQTLVEAIGEHLINFGVCTDEKDVNFVCETLFEELSKEVPEEEDDDEGYNSDRTYDDGECILCERVMPLTFHHLIPRCTHKKVNKHGEFTKKELNRGIMVCRPCHSALHRFIDEDTMANDYNTLDRLLEHENVQSWIPYASKLKEVSKSDASLYHSGKLKYKK
ncbi:hypothetical protein AKO1_011611 [Acrasis kona]|uniref:HNH endonuclease n=1 Tax=Acrasis kona TaxID=1008807 RepID=A0AAW2Z6N8_9EUKA